MKFLIFRLFVILLTFFIGVLAAAWYLPDANQLDTDDRSVVQVPTPALLAEPHPQRSEVETRLEKTNSGLRGPIPREDIENLTATLQKIVAFTHKKGVQTFFVSKVIHDEGRDFAYAYWPKDDSITILHLPLSPEPNESELYWLTMKARIELKNNIVPKGKYENLGCCLVEKPWVDEVLSRCKAGYKLKILGKH